MNNCNTTAKKQENKKFNRKKNNKLSIKNKKLLKI